MPEALSGATNLGFMILPNYRAWVVVASLVVCVGTCGVSGGAFYDSYALAGPVGEVVPVDVYVPGCPPRPEAIVHGIAKALEKLEKSEA